MPPYAALGNEDYFAGMAEELTPTLENTGTPVLENEALPLEGSAGLCTCCDVGVGILGLAILHVCVEERKSPSNGIQRQLDVITQGWRPSRPDSRAGGVFYLCAVQCWPEEILRP